MNKILQILQNPIASDSAQGIYALYSSKASFYESFSREPPIKKMEIYVYPEHFQVSTAKGLQTFSEKKQIPPNLSIIHSIAHIEYNAMKAYLDTLLRFYHDIEFSYQKQFFDDFLEISFQEATHFEALDCFLKKNGLFYGYLPGLHSIREEVSKTVGSLIERIVIIALVQEGKGLDAGPHLLNKLKAIHKNQQQEKKCEDIEILRKIVDEELAHVSNGVKWFKILTRSLKEDERKKTFQQIISKHCGNANRKVQNMNWKAREKAGFQRNWFEDP